MANIAPRVTLVVAVWLVGCGKPSGSAETVPPASVFIQSGELEMGDAAARLPWCTTVETDWGVCLEAGTYVGDPVLLMGRTPYVSAEVDIDYHGAEAPRVPCPERFDAGVCLERLPFGSATIVIKPGGVARR